MCSAARLCLVVKRGCQYPNYGLTTESQARSVPASDLYFGTSHSVNKLSVTTFTSNLPERQVQSDTRTRSTLAFAVHTFCHHYIALHQVPGRSLCSIWKQYKLPTGPGTPTPGPRNPPCLGQVRPRHIEPRLLQQVDEEYYLSCLPTNRLVCGVEVTYLSNA